VQPVRGAFHEALARPLRELPEVQRLPPPYALQIGRIVSRWAYQEWLFSQVLYELAGVSKKVGRLVIVRRARADDCVTMIVDVMRLCPIAVATDMEAIRAAANKAEANRDTVAHALWLRGPAGDLRVWKTSGRKTLVVGQPKVSRRHRPTSTAFTVRDLARMVREMDVLIRQTKELQRQIRSALAALPAEQRAGVRWA
jgi:hypothetical protein